MKVRMIALGCLCVSLVGFNAGCPFSLSPPESLNNLSELPDADGDGFADLDGPEGTETVAVSIVNEITRADAEALAEQFVGEVPAGLAAVVAVEVNFTITRIYEGDQTFMDMGSRALQPFDDLAIEAVCPETVVVAVDVVASVPILGNFEVLPTQEFTLVEGDGGRGTFVCGKVIMVTAAIDESTGQPDIDLVIEDQE